MDIVKTLIQSVTRGFYDLRSMLIIDALLVHSALSDDEFQILLGVQKKDLRAACSKLKDDHMLTDHVQKIEIPNQRPQSKTYYYIHYTETVDAIKWKMHNIVNSLKQQMGNDAQPQGYVCDRCKKRYTQMEALTTFNPERDAFICDVCGEVLRQDDSTAENQANQERLGNLMTQIQPIIDALRKIDDVVIAENTFASSFAQQVPVVTENGAPMSQPILSSSANALPAAKSRAGDNSINGSAQFTVQITSEKENAELEQKQKEEKERMAAENALPTWHVESTVGKTMGESYKDEIKTEDVKPVIEDAVDNTKQEEGEKEQEDELAAYYAQLEAQQQEEDDEEEEDDDEDEEEDFEEVAI